MFCKVKFVQHGTFEIPLKAVKCLHRWTVTFVSVASCFIFLGSFPFAQVLLPG